MAEQSFLAGVAGRYAEALFELADGTGALDPVAQDLRDLAAMLQGSADLTALIRSPLLKAEDQGRALAAVADAAKFHGLTKNILGLLAQNRRLPALPGVIEGFRSLLAAKRGQSTAQVTSAYKLSDEDLADLAAILKKSTGKDVQLNAAVDPGLLGGLVVKVGSRMIDTSLRTKLDNLKIAMKGVQ